MVDGMSDLLSNADDRIANSSGEVATLVGMGEELAATRIQARVRGRSARGSIKSYSYKPSHALGWLQQVQANELDSDDINVDFLQSEALLELGKMLKKLDKQRSKLAARVDELEARTDDTMSERVAALEHRTAAAEERAQAAEQRIQSLILEQHQLQQQLVVQKREAEHMADAVTRLREGSAKTANQSVEHSQLLTTLEWRLGLLEEARVASEHRSIQEAAAAMSVGRDVSLRIDAVHRELQAKYTDTRTDMAKQIVAVERRWEGVSAQRNQRDDDDRRSVAELGEALAALRAQSMQHGGDLTRLKPPLEALDSRMRVIEQQVSIHVSDTDAHSALTAAHGLGCDAPSPWQERFYLRSSTSESPRALMHHRTVVGGERPSSVITKLPMGLDGMLPQLRSMRESDLFLSSVA